MVERQAGPEDRGEHHLVGRFAADAFSERGFYFNIAIIEALGDLVGHDLAEAVEIVAEAHRIFLDFHIAQLQHIAVGEAGAVGEINYFHHDKTELYANLQK